MPTKSTEEINPGHDLIWGARAIAAEIGQTTPRAYFLLEQQHLPAKKIGERWVMSRRAWRKRLGIPEEVA